MSELVAIDRDTGKVLSPDETTRAADNPMIYTWVSWVEAVSPAREAAHV